MLKIRMLHFLVAFYNDFANVFSHTDIMVLGNRKLIHFGDQIFK